MDWARASRYASAAWMLASLTRYSASDRAPLLWLQRRQVSCRFPGSLVPPWWMGTMWSTLARLEMSRWR